MTRRVGGVRIVAAKWEIFHEGGGAEQKGGGG